jgi:hypothetical protein
MLGRCRGFIPAVAVHGQAAFQEQELSKWRGHEGGETELSRVAWLHFTVYTNSSTGGAGADLVSCLRKQTALSNGQNE